jgi:F0F1-type ATP synthase assembly protein I
MAARPLDPKEMGFYVSLAQVGMEMAVPAAVGLWLDNQFGWQPWGVISGAVLGFVTGMLHLLQLLSRQPNSDSNRPHKGPP